MLCNIVERVILSKLYPLHKKQLGQPAKAA